MVTRGKRERARRALQRLRGVDDVSAELEDLERAAAAAGERAPNLKNFKRRPAALGGRWRG